MSLTTTAPLSLPHADRPHLSMSYPPTADDRSYQGYYGRPAPGSAHSAAAPEAPSSAPRLHSSGGNNYPKGAPQSSPSHVYSSPHDLGPAPGSSHGYPPQPITPLSGSTGYPPQPTPPYYGMPGQPQDPSLPSPPPTATSRPTTANNFAPEGGAGAPIVPVGISGGKMFRCRGFGECDKVFTRSEHLARHVRKHTGERPFPCHCGKAFSRLDNLRQHAATVHADQTQLNEAMLSSLASVHAALSQRANREQRRRGEVVEVPKNAIERPRGDRGAKVPPNAPPGTTAVPPPGAVYPPAPGYHQAHPWGAPPDHGRPRTGGGGWMDGGAYPYVQQPGMTGDHPPPPSAGSVTYAEDAGPSRRPPSSTGSYPHPGYYEHGPPTSSHGRPSTTNAPPGTAGSDDPQAYPYRPVSSNGRELPVPGHYSESEPPSSAHGPPPHSPMYPHQTATVPAAGNWTSPPTPHSGYPPADPSVYPQNPTVPSGDSAHSYPPGEQGGHSGYGPPPPGSAGGYYYPPQGQYPYPAGQQSSPAQQQNPTFSSVAPPGSAGAPPTGAYPANYSGPPGESPFQYSAPGGNYPYPGYDGRKRRAEDETGGDRKHQRSGDGGPNSTEPRAAGAPGQDPLWLPSTAERRSSLAISALIGSPQQDARSRPATADATAAPAGPAA